MVSHELASLPADIEQAIRRAHPAGDYEVLDVSRFDLHLSDVEIERMTEEISAIVSLVGEFELASPPYDRSHTIYVTDVSGPSRSEIVHRSSELDKRKANQVEDPIVWTIKLSRLGPFWFEKWQSFSTHGGKVAADMCEEPNTYPWNAIANVRSLLSNRGLRRISSAELYRQVPWIATEKARSLRSFAHGKPPDVYECLFSGIY